MQCDLVSVHSPWHKTSKALGASQVTGEENQPLPAHGVSAPDGTLRGRRLTARGASQTRELALPVWATVPEGRRAWRLITASSPRDGATRGSGSTPGGGRLTADSTGAGALPAALGPWGLLQVHCDTLGRESRAPLSSGSRWGKSPNLLEGGPSQREGG